MTLPCGCSGPCYCAMIWPTISALEDAMIRAGLLKPGELDEQAALSRNSAPYLSSNPPDETL